MINSSSWIWNDFVYLEARPISNDMHRKMVEMIAENGRTILGTKLPTVIVKFAQIINKISEIKS